MQIRQATKSDVNAVSAIYDAIHDMEEAGLSSVGWVRGVYPTRETALRSEEKGELYVLEADGIIRASARFNHEQESVYVQGNWAVPASGDQVLVMHTLTVDPSCARQGFGRAFVAWYEAEAKRRGCVSLRMDTNARNARARSMYAALGFAERGIAPCEFNGIGGVSLVLLEKVL